MDDLKQIHVLSLGAGVQSTTLALLATHGVIEPTPTAAIFADTGAEPAAVYQHLEWLMAPGRLSFPVHIVSAGNLQTTLLDPNDKRRSHARPPLYVLNADGSGGIIQRQCTREFKIDPIQRRIRDMLGLVPRQRWPKTSTVVQWIGISIDEASRMKPSWLPAIEMRWPLIELRMSRRDCLQWLIKNGYPEPPRSARTFCPFRSDGEWRRLRDTDPDGWRNAIEVDRAIRHGLTSKTLTGALFVHRSRVPLEDVDLSTAEEHGQLNLFENECEGMCGV
jgi:hypothetical protein